MAGEYVRASATDLPFRDGSFDAVCCFAALYLIEDPLQAVAEIVRVLAPGGRVALLSSVARGPVPARLADAGRAPADRRADLRPRRAARELRASGLVDVDAAGRRVAQLSARGRRIRTLRWPAPPPPPTPRPAPPQSPVAWT